LKKKKRLTIKLRKTYVLWKTY